MGAAGVFAFAPLGASAPLASASELETITTQTGGLIVPKKDDPVIYTTESGLDIKFGLATIPSWSHSGSSSVTGNLTGFPYFTTSKSGTTYVWVVIGRAPDVQLFSSGRYQQAFSSWKSDYLGQEYNYPVPYSKYFFDTVYENSTPAGSAINSVVPSKSYVFDISPNNGPKTNPEIPSGCILCLSNSITGESFFGAGGGDNNTDKTYAMYLSDLGTKNGVRSDLLSYATNDTFGFGSNLDSIKNTTITQRTYISSWVNYSATFKFFPLANYSSSYENFMWQSYLTATQVKTTGNFWGRSVYDTSNNVYITNTSGSVTYTAGRWSTSKCGLRPACVLSIV